LYGGRRLEDSPIRRSPSRRLEGSVADIAVDAAAEYRAVFTERAGALLIAIAWLVVREQRHAGTRAARPAQHAEPVRHAGGVARHAERGKRAAQMRRGVAFHVDRALGALRARVAGQADGHAQVRVAVATQVLVGAALERTRLAGVRQRAARARGIAGAPD